MDAPLDMETANVLLEYVHQANHTSIGRLSKNPEELTAFMLHTQKIIDVYNNHCPNARATSEFDARLQEVEAVHERLKKEFADK